MQCNQEIENTDKVKLEEENDDKEIVATDQMESDQEETEHKEIEVSRREARKCAQVNRIQLREKERFLIKEVRKVLIKNAWDRTSEDSKLLEDYPEAVLQVNTRILKQTQLKDRLKEVEDPSEELDVKCHRLAAAIQGANFVVVYTGAGISTAAQIPDYRGPSGIWTLLRRGQEIDSQDLTVATPTFSHMALNEMHKRGIVQHIVSQNCDGLHMRSGLHQKALSEVHGNMYIEACTSCKPHRQFVRLFDVTEKTALRRHKTGRRCHLCGQDLKDTIVHFGERGKMRWPLNWEGAARMAKKADLILCLGSSLKVLKRYPCLWFSEGDKANVYIVNLQWTPKDEQATLKINGKCDQVMQRVMQYLNIPVPQYIREKDPIFHLATDLLPREKKTMNTNILLVKNEEEEGEGEEENGLSVITTCSQTVIDCVSNTVELRDSKLESIENVDEEINDGEEEETVKKIKVCAGGGWFGKGLAKIKKNKCKK